MLASQRYTSHFGSGRRGVAFGVFPAVVFPVAVGREVVGREVVELEALGLVVLALSVSGMFGLLCVASSCVCMYSAPIVLLCGVSGKSERTAYGSSGTPTGEARMSLLTRFLYFSA